MADKNFTMLKTGLVQGGKVSIDDYNKEMGDVYCPLGHRLVAKKGKIVIHHFAHYPGQGCDPWRKGMTNWHHQWQTIVENHIYLEIPLNAAGKLVQFDEKVAHIADIVNPKIQIDGRWQVIEVQHSPMSTATIEAREKHYVNMIWLFDFTPRVVKKGDHNSMAMVDGKMVYLRNLVEYSAIIMTGPSRTCDYPECLTGEQVDLYGVFFVVKTRTRYWFEADKPKYFDTGFGILLFICRLNKSLHLMKYMPYATFILTKMPPVNKEKVLKCSWFHDLGPTDVIKMNLCSLMINLQEGISVSKNRIELKSKKDFNNLGFRKEGDLWVNGCSQTVSNPIRVSADTRSVEEQNLDFLPKSTMRASNQKVSDIRIIEIVRRKLCLSSSVKIEIDESYGKRVLLVHCCKGTYGSKAKFKSLNMKYRRRRGTPGIWHASIDDLKKEIREI